MAAGTSASIATARWLVGVIGCVVLSFVVATIVSQEREGAIAAHADALVGNAMPSVEALSRARGDLRALENRLEDYALATPGERGALRDRIALARQDLEGTLATYQSLPFFPRERALSAHVADQHARLDARIEGFLSAPDPAGVAEIHHALDALDAAIGHAVSFDAAQGQREGRDIEAIHAHAIALLTLLDALSVALAIVAGVLALRQLTRVTRELAAENEALGQFAGRVAHDVLSPLSAAELALDLIRREHAEDPVALRASERGVRAIHRVHTLVDDLLAFSRAGGQPEPGASAELAAVIDDVIAELAAEASARDIALVVAPVPDGAIACAAGVLTSLISNLIRNAIKYMGDAAERRIDVRVREAGARWRVEVEDTGPGIPTAQQARIFQPYVQLARGAAGIGLGLATVDRLVRAHGGEVGVVSSPGRGARFWFELPRATRPSRAARSQGSGAAA
jgi:signal transduction histidine kinase